jgi:hypothetical protein
MKTKEEIFYMVHKSPSLAAEEWYEVQNAYNNILITQASIAQGEAMEAMIKARQRAPAMTEEEILEMEKADEQNRRNRNTGF